MADKYGKVTNPRYTFRGAAIPRGTIVKLTDAQLEAQKDRVPADIEEVPAPEKPEDEAAAYDIRPERFAAELQSAEAGVPPARPNLKKQ